MNKILSVVFLGCCTSIANAQVTEKQLAPFFDGLTLIDASGPGLNQASGDILLELASNEPNENETLVLLRNEKGKLYKISANPGLLMGEDMLGVSGGNYPSLSSNLLSVDYTIGSNSAQSDISLKFEKNEDGHYDFTGYTSATRNYGVENLFARQRITASQTGRISFAGADEARILETAGVNPLPDDTDEPVYKAIAQYAEYIPEGWRLAAFADGDLNLDSYKKDLLLVLYNEASCSIRLLMQQKDDSYQIAQYNEELLIPDETFNVNNLKAVIKNGFFTVEQRVAMNDDDFDHRYVTFKYDAGQQNWLLHRFDVEHYAGFDPQPGADVLHLTKKEFGMLSFPNMTDLPGIYQYEPALSVISGTIIKKLVYGRPNYGETPEKDEKIWVYLLKTDYPISVMAAAHQPDPETADQTVTGISEIQVYSAEQNPDFKNWENKKVTLQGVFQAAQTGHQYTSVLLEVKAETDTDSIAILLPTQYRKESTGYPKGVEEKEWFEIYQVHKTGEWKIGKADLDISYGRDECVGEDVMIIQSKHEDAELFFTPFDGLSLQPTTILDNQTLYPEHNVSFNFRGKEYKLLPMGSCLDENGQIMPASAVRAKTEDELMDNTKISGYRLSFEAAGKSAYEIASVETIDYATPRLVWVGDLNDDGLPDMILDLPGFYESRHLFFFLSDKNDQEQPLKKVADLLVVNDC